MDFKHCRAFVAVADHLHFTKAAELIHVTQPTLTHLIQQLEDTLTVKLLDRSTRQVALTSMGEEFLPMARRIVRDAEKAVDHMRGLASLKQGKVAVAAFPSVAVNQLPPLIVEYRARFPGIDVRIHDGIWEKVIDDVKTGIADFGIASAPHLDEDLTFQPLYDDQIILIAPNSHPWSDRKEVLWHEIGDEEIIMLSDNTGVRQSMDDALAGSQLTFNSILEPSLIQTVAALVSAGAGIGVILSSYVEVIRQENLVTIPIRKPTIHRPVGIITQKGRELTPAARQLFQMAQDFF